MIEPEPWQALDEEIAQWAAPPALWLRDDDATGPAPAVATLLNACAVGRVPVCLAVIPSLLDPEFFPLANVTGRLGHRCPARTWAHQSRPGGAEKVGIRGSSAPQRDFEGSPRRAPPRSGRFWCPGPADLRAALEPLWLNRWGRADRGRIHRAFRQNDPDRGDRYHCRRCPHRHNRLARKPRIWRRWTGSWRPTRTFGRAAGAGKGERTDGYLDPSRRARPGRLDLPGDPLQSARRQGGLAQRG